MQLTSNCRKWWIQFVDTCQYVTSFLSVRSHLIPPFLHTLDVDSGVDMSTLVLLCSEGNNCLTLQGLNKTAAIAEFGEETVTKWRRSYDTRPPNGESLQVSYTIGYSN